VKRYRVVGFCRKDADPSTQPNSVYLLVTQDQPGENCSIRLIDTDLDEAIEAFQRGWIELGSEIAPNNNRRL